MGANPYLNEFAKIFGVHKQGDDDQSSGNGSRGGNHLEHLASLVCQAHPNLDRASALRWLLRSKNGRALFARTIKRKEQQMQQPESFEQMCKSMGVERVCKAICANGPTSRITENELTEAMTAHAKRIFPDDKPDVAFAKVFTANDEAGTSFRRAVSICKGMPRMTLVPTQVSGESVDDGGNAYDALMAKAAELRKADGSLSEAQAFSKAFSDPANRALAAAERRQARARLGIGGA